MVLLMAQLSKFSFPSNKQSESKMNKGSKLPKSFIQFSSYLFIIKLFIPRRRFSLIFVKFGDMFLGYLF